ncbi:hypothetical protein F4860DRAFT_243714 [Xylaria cubensis]|nr:hypothetical protein F4860DRAFT_243714 [Xylaria cubensis]
MDFDIRCIECAKEYMLYELLQSQGILANSDDEGTTCTHDGCSSPRLHCAIFCAVHILSHTVNTGPCKMDHQTLILQQLEVTPIWKVDRSSNFGVFLNRRQLTGAPAFFSSDLEVYISKHPPVIKQAAAIKIESMDSKEEQIMFNVNIDNPQAIDREGLLLEAEIEVQDFVLNLYKIGTRDYWQYNQENLSGERVNPLQAATIIRDSGITCHDYIIVWHTGYQDVRALRHLLMQAGIQDVLPPDDHIIRLNYLFRYNLDLSQGITC